MDEEAQQMERAIWAWSDYARAVTEIIEQRDDLHSHALALAKECEARYGEAPDVPTLPLRLVETKNHRG